MAFLTFAPQLGAKPSGEHLEKIKSSPNYKENQFVNLIETKMDYSLPNMWGMIKDGIASKHTSPKEKLTTFFEADRKMVSSDSTAVVTWYGHSAVLLEIEGKRIFLDPMLGPAASPVPVFGKRFGNNPAFTMDVIDHIDAVIYSHDHYDHLDYSSVLVLKDKVDHFYTPLGVGSHLIKWGVDPAKITELDWWEEIDFHHFKLVATPARHFSGRSIGDSNKTLWASWVILGEKYRIYFSGDSGYGPHFKEIGNKYGPFDLAMMECGQYNERWEPIHMLPKQTVKASADIQGKAIMPIHWGAFSLAPHSWTEPVEQVSTLSKEAEINLITPELGRPFVINEDFPSQRWWNQAPSKSLAEK